MSVIIDVQGFKGENNEFIPKEIAFLNSKNMWKVFILKPPYAFKKLSPKYQQQAIWLYNNHHGLSWNSGNDTPNNVAQYIINNNLLTQKIYVKGLEKKNWLLKVFQFIDISLINNLEDFDCPNLQQLRTNNTTMDSCNNHKGFCALQNCFLLNHWIQENKINNF